MKKLENSSGDTQVQDGEDFKSFEETDIRSNVATDAMYFFCQVNTVVGDDLWGAAPGHEAAFKGEIIEFVGLRNL